MQLLVLDATTKTIEAVLGEAATTQPVYTVHYADSTATDVTEGSLDGALNSTTDVTVVSAPGASTRRIVKEISIYNGDNIAHTVTLQYDNNGTERIIWAGTLEVGATFILSKETSYATRTTGAGYTVLTDGATVDIDHSLNSKFVVTLGGNRTLTLSNPVTGKLILLDIIQDGTGSRTVTWFSINSNFATTDVDATNDIITVGRNIPTGTPIIFTSTTTAPAGITAGTTYYAINNSATAIKVATSLANAQAGTAVNITDQGTGTHTVKTQIRWAGGSAPTLTTTKYQKDTFGIMIVDATNGIMNGYVIGQNL